MSFLLLWCSSVWMCCLCVCDLRQDWLFMDCHVFSYTCCVYSWWLHTVLLFSPEQATSSTGVNPQWPAPTLHDPCLDERSLGERGEEGARFLIFLFCYFSPHSIIPVAYRVILSNNHMTTHPTISLCLCHCSISDRKWVVIHFSVFTTHAIRKLKEEFDLWLILFWLHPVSAGHSCI